VKNALTIASIFLLGSCHDRSLDVCDDAIKATLRSPSTYKRISIDGGYGSFTVQYDAANAYGTPIRGNGRCYVHDNGHVVWREAPR